MVLLLPVRAASSQLSLTTSWVSQKGVASLAVDWGLSVTEDGLNSNAGSAFDIHEVGVGGLHQSLLLVLLFFRREGWVSEVDGERHFFIVVFFLFFRS